MKFHLKNFIGDAHLQFALWWHFICQ